MRQRERQTEKHSERGHARLRCGRAQGDGAAAEGTGAVSGKTRAEDPFKSGAVQPVADIAGAKGGGRRKAEVMPGGKGGGGE